jgi:pimeloyl-ACP methyl ester carboxylesterase
VPPATVRIDVSGALPFGAGQYVSCWVFPPKDARPGTPVLFCLPGGTYTKGYWHLEVPGRAGYSFAEYLADAGMLVIALDHLGTGESTPHPRALDLTLDVVAAANSAVVDEIRERAAKGTLADGMPPLSLGPTVAVGHSMGALLAIYQQSLFHSYDALAALGYGTSGPISRRVHSTGAPMPSRESVLQEATSGTLDGTPAVSRHAPDLRRHFYWDDVPEDVKAADDLTATHLPGMCGRLSLVPFIASDHARRIECPVFIGLGERDSTSGHHDEPRGYASSQDVTLFVLPRSGHCHNTAGTRELLWARLRSWITTLPQPAASSS